MTKKQEPEKAPEVTEPIYLNDGLNLWETVSTPRHEHTKSFSRAGGFKGTSVNVTAMAMMATEVFGPNGIGWGVVIEDEQYIDGHKWLTDAGDIIGNDVVHVIRAHIWYTIEGEKYETSPQFGQTTFIGRNKYGPFTDEEAPKKSISDAQNKCLSLLGFASDIFLGKWDDSKYLAEVKKQQAGDDAAAEPENAPKFTRTNDGWHGPLNKTDLKASAQTLAVRLEQVLTEDDFKELANEYRPMVEQLQQDLPTWYFGDQNQPGMKQKIVDKKQQIQARAA